MSNTFVDKYIEMWPDEKVLPDGSIETKSGKLLNMYMYSRRKMAVVRSMTASDLYSAFKEFGLKKNMKKEEMIHIITNNSWRI